MRVSPTDVARSRRLVMKVVRTCAVALLCLAFLAGSASAETTKLNGAKVSIWFPDDWSMEKEGTMLVISDPAEDVGLMFLTVPAENADMMLEILDEQINAIAKNVKPKGDVQELDINGMTAWVLESTGRIDGKVVDIDSVIIYRPGKKALIILGIGEPKRVAKHEAVLTKIFSSMKPF
jgi:hypothetical protein